MNELFSEFQEFRKILCVCPCCGELVRVSDLKLKAKGAVRTWLDDYEGDLLRFGRKEEKFSEIEEKLRKKSVEKGRLAAEKAVNNAISPALRALRLNPFDVKPILHPVDFVVFKGMNKTESVSEVMFLSKWCASLESVRKGVEKAVKEKKYEWVLARIDEKGGVGVE